MLKHPEKLKYKRYWIKQKAHKAENIYRHTNPSKFDATPFPCIWMGGLPAATNPHRKRLPPVINYRLISAAVFYDPGPVWFSGVRVIYFPSEFPVPVLLDTGRTLSVALTKLDKAFPVGLVEKVVKFRKRFFFRRSWFLRPLARQTWRRPIWASRRPASRHSRDRKTLRASHRPVASSNAQTALANSASFSTTCYRKNLVFVKKAKITLPLMINVKLLN